MHLIAVTTAEDSTALVEATVGELGRVDILVNNAGASIQPRDPESPDEFRQVIEVDLLGAYRRVALPV